MSARDNTEEVLRQIHILFAEAEPVSGSARRVIVDKVKLMDLLKELNTDIYAMMEEYELTRQGKEKAEREMQKKGDDIRLGAKKDAEDIYAASMMYTERSLREVQDSMDETLRALETLLRDTRTSLEKQKAAVHDNQLDVRAHLRDMIDSDKYLRLIQDENLRIEKEKELEEIRGSGKGKTAGTSGTTAPSAAVDIEEDDESPYKKIVPEIKINPAYDPAARMNAETEGDIELSAEEMADLDRLQEELLDEKNESFAGDTKPKDTSKKPFSFGGLFGKN